ncbi:hypothetical protein EDD16DRAFT_1069761 [Pisolithus croceorrhizus]|nr:hypothetical protein EDD16DRAFT_1069761 [Pisolithus croceorrhizus]
MNSFRELEFKNVFVPITVGAVVSTIFLGCAIVQANSYYKKFPADSWLLKVLVATEMLLQLMRTPLLIIAVWQLDYGQPQPLVFIHTSLSTVIILSASTAFLAQATFSVLLYKLFWWPIIFVIHLSLTALRFVLHITIGVESYGTINLGELVQQWYWCITTILILSFICDTFVTASLTYQLKMQKTAFTQSLQVIDRMTALTFATGFLASVVELSAAICFWTLPGNYTWVSLLIVVSGLYTVSVLAALNQRRQFHHMLPDHDCGVQTGPEPMPSVRIVRTVNHSVEQSF